MAISSQTNPAFATTTVSGSALEVALHKIASVEVPQGRHIALAYSSGLDSSLCVKLSAEKYHARQLTAITVDVGQGEQEMQESVERASHSGLFFPDVRSIKSASFNQKESAPAAHLRGIPYELIARRDAIAAGAYRD